MFLHCLRIQITQFSNHERELSCENTMLRGRLYLDLFIFCFLYLVHLLYLKQTTASQLCLLLSSPLQSFFVGPVTCEGPPQRSGSLLLETRVRHRSRSESTTHPALDSTWNKGWACEKCVFTTDHLFSDRRSLTCSWKFSWEIRTPANRKAFHRASCLHQLQISLLGEIVVLFLWLWCSFPQKRILERWFVVLLESQNWCQLNGTIQCLLFPEIAVSWFDLGQNHTQR